MQHNVGPWISDIYYNLSISLFQTELEEIAIDVSSEKDIIAGEEKQPK